MQYGFNLTNGFRGKMPEYVDGQQNLNDLEESSENDLEL